MSESAEQMHKRLCSVIAAWSMAKANVDVDVLD
jgi:hypothetical protein